MVDKHPIPRIRDILSTLSGGKSFTKLDLAHAYQQVLLDEDSQKLITINTPKGLYQYNRLPFGISSTPAIFQRVMEILLQGIPNVSVYIDDILITGRTQEEHLQNLQVVLSRLERAGLRLKRPKYTFMLPSLDYLGYRISAEGIQPTKEKVGAILEAPDPQNISQLRSFLRMLNYCVNFLPNLSTTLPPLYSLLQKSKKWTWGEAQKRAFQKAKESLTGTNIFFHYDQEKELLL